MSALTKRRSLQHRGRRGIQMSRTRLQSGEPGKAGMGMEVGMGMGLGLGGPVLPRLFPCLPSWTQSFFPVPFGCTQPLPPVYQVTTQPMGGHPTSLPRGPSGSTQSPPKLASMYPTSPPCPPWLTQPLSLPAHMGSPNSRGEGQRWVAGPGEEGGSDATWGRSGVKRDPH